MQYIWEDKKRILGMPISFTWYKMTSDRLFVKKGLLSTKEDQSYLYRVNDIQVRASLWQKFWGVGTVVVFGQDLTDDVLLLKNIEEPYKVREIIYKYSEEAKRKKGVQYSEFSSVGNNHPPRPQ